VQEIGLGNAGALDRMGDGLMTDILGRAHPKTAHLWLKGAETRRGRLQRHIARTFILFDGQPLTVGDILPRCYVDGRYSDSRRHKLRRALRLQAVVVGRVMNRRGQPLLWAPKTPTTAN
jgi:hypothetical protein